MSFPPNPSTGGGGGSFVINDDHFFADDTARDAYFVLHPDELGTGTLIYVDPGYQQYNGSSWVDVTAVVTGPQGDPGEDADNVWGTLTGTLNDQTDLKNALDAKIPTSQKGAASGVAELNSSGIIPTAQLPSYVDDVLEYANAAALPATGESSKIYFTLDNGKQFRWGGTTYVEIITGGVALGETSDTAYRGDRGKTAYDHSQSLHAPSDAEKNVQADWNETNINSDAYIKNKPTNIGSSWGSITGTLADQTDLDTALGGKVPTTRTVNSKALSSDISLTASDVGAATTTDITYETLNTNGDVGSTSGTVCAGDDSRLSNARTPDINGLTAETSIADNDYISIYDTSASAHRKMTRSDFLSGVPGYVDDIIGVKWDSSSSSPTLTRVDEDLQEIPGSYINWPKYFNLHPIWGQMWRCNLTAGGVATFGTNPRGDGLTLTDDYTMVRIPRVYHRFVYDDGDWYWLVSPEPSSGFSLHPTFNQRGHSASPAEQAYVGAYDAHDAGSSKLGSKSGTTPLVNQTMATFESRGNNIGAGWGLMNFHTLCLLQMLFYIEYASFDLQSKVGPGYTNAANTGPITSGSAAAFERPNGTSVGTTDVQAVSWRGIENLWGNIWQFIPGYNTTDTSHRILKRDGAGTIADVLASGSYEEIVDPIPLNGTTHVSGADAGTYCHGYVSAFDRDSSNILGPMFIPGALLGASDQYLTDYFYSHQSGISQTGVLLAGGSWAGGLAAGVGYRRSTYGPSAVSASFGGHLELLI